MSCVCWTRPCPRPASASLPRGDRATRCGRRNPASARGCSRCCRTSPRSSSSTCPDARSAIADVREPANIPRVAAACRRLHAGPRFGNDFSIFGKMHELLETVSRARSAHARRLPRPAIHCGRASGPAWPPTRCRRCRATTTCSRRTSSTPAARSGSSTTNSPATTTPPSNSATSPPSRDFDPDRAERLAAAYFGEDLTPALVARVRLNLLLSNVTWTLWFSVHHGLLRQPERQHPRSTTGPRRATSGRQASRDLDSPELGRLIDLVTGARRTIPTHPQPSHPEPHLQGGYT